MRDLLIPFVTDDKPTILCQCLSQVLMLASNNKKVDVTLVIGNLIAVVHDR